MGSSGVDFGAVSTAGLIMRAKRIGQQKKNQIDRALLLTKKGKARRKAFIDATLAHIDEAYELVQTDKLSEEKLRHSLIHLLDPKMSGGERDVQIKW